LLWAVPRFSSLDELAAAARRQYPEGGGKKWPVTKVATAAALPATGRALATCGPWPVITPSSAVNVNKHKKTRRGSAGFLSNAERCRNQAELLQFDFLVFNVLAHFGIKFHDQHFVRCGFLVLGGRVEMTRTSR
jgi:hypothetical protein